jgi:hypothetical protein
MALIASSVSWLGLAMIEFLGHCRNVKSSRKRFVQEKKIMTVLLQMFEPKSVISLNREGVRDLISMGDWGDL